jgi:hypothetical protein
MLTDLQIRQFFYPCGVQLPDPQGISAKILSYTSLTLLDIVGNEQIYNKNVQIRFQLTAPE